MKVVLDTNALMIPYQFKIDIIDEIRKLMPNAKLVIIDSTIRELKNISDKRAAQFALKIIQENNIEQVREPGETDSAVITYAQKNGYVVFTNDAEMKKKCLKFGVPVMFMRKKKMIQLEGL